MNRPAVKSDSSTVEQPDALFALARICSALYKFEAEHWRRLMQAAIDAGNNHRQLYEAILQCYLFLGYPAALEGLRIWFEIAGLTIHDGFESWRESGSEWRIRGEHTCRAVYRRRFPTLQSRIAAISPELSEWMIVEGYGKVLSRGGLALSQREFLIAVLLGAGTFSRQFEAHLFGCKNVGVPAEWLRLWFDKEPGALSGAALPVWRKFRSRFL